MDREAWRATVHGVAKSQTPQSTYVYYGLETICLRITWEHLFKSQVPELGQKL